MIEDYENEHNFTPRNITISYNLFRQMQDHKFVKEWEDTVKYNDLAIITDIGMTNVWVDKNAKSKIVVG
jgi:hypothetical protein